MTTKEFPTATVLTIVTGRLLCKMDAVYEILNWMTGENLFTHQLPRVGEEAKPVILAMHPHLKSAVDEADQVTGENYRAWLTTWEERFGPSIAVPKLNIAQHERIDPLSELAEKIPPERIIGVTVKNMMALSLFLFGPIRPRVFGE